MRTFAKRSKKTPWDMPAAIAAPGRSRIESVSVGATSPHFAYDVRQIPVYPALSQKRAPASTIQRSTDWVSQQESDIFDNTFGDNTLGDNTSGDNIFGNWQPPSEEEGDLTNPRFKGDPALEDCYDGRRLFSVGSSGEAVAKIQSGIKDYFIAKDEPNPLPVYGADGSFGQETRSAVVKFQNSVGFIGQDVDGVVGHNTMDKLDKEVPADTPPGVDPDTEDCLGCKPIATITKKVGNTTTVFGLCDDNFDVFNTGSGDVKPGPGCLAQSSNTRSVINFWSGTPNGPAWQTVAHIRDCTTPASASNSPTPWEIGFIQTVESANFSAVYDNNNFVSVTNQNARDALVTRVNQQVQVPQAPWYDKKGNPFGPQEYPTIPMINDTPNISFSITHPDTNRDFLRSVCMTAKFNIWLIINRKGVTPTPSNVDFFYHWSIEMNHTYSLSGAGAHPCNISQWTKSGSQSMSNKGPNKGSAALVWDQPIAKLAEVTDTKLKTNPCG